MELPPVRSRGLCLKGMNEPELQISAGEEVTVQGGGQAEQQPLRTEPKSKAIEDGRSNGASSKRLIFGEGRKLRMGDFRSGGIPQGEFCLTERVRVR